MKAFLYSLLVLTVFISCNGSADSRKETDDSLAYYPPTPAQLKKAEFRNYYNAINTFYDTMLVKSGFSGGMLVAKKGVILFERYTGLSGKDSITATTPFHIASTSKTFTAMAVLKLAEEGKLNPDDSLTRFFPGFPVPGVTVKMLLNHRSGLSNYVYYLPSSKWNKKQIVQNADVLTTLSTLKPKPNFKAGTHFSYSNTNYVLLALLVEKITGQSLHDYLQQQFFKPLGMEHSFVYSITDSLKTPLSRTAQGGDWKNDFLDATYGDKNIYTTPRDLLRWSEATDSTLLFQQTTLDSAWKGYSFEKPSIHNYGLGWRLMLLPNGKKVVYHYGRWHGFNAAFAKLPEEKVTVIILGNRFNRRIYSARLLFNLFGDYQQQPDSEDEREGLIGEKNEVFQKKAAPQKSKTSKKGNTKKP